jgi:hypothetical protein
MTGLSEGTSVKVVLPFKFEKQKKLQNASIGQIGKSPAFIQTLPEDLPLISNRANYFASDLASQLLLQIEYYEWSEKTPRDLNIGSADAPISVTLLPPTLVLFETGDASKPKSPSVGFLSLEFCWTQPTSMFSTLEQSLQVWLNFCEEVRYWQAPFWNSKPHYSHLNWGPAHESSNSEFKKYENWLRQDLVATDCSTYSLCPAYWFEQASRMAAIVPDGKLPADLSLHKALNETGWLVYADMRAYSWSLIVTPQGSKDLNHGQESIAWVKVLNSDKAWDSNLQIPAAAFEKEWVRERTYQRWADAGSLYGFTYHSGAAWIPPYREPPLAEHFRWLYFDMAILLLYIRVSLFDFSKRITELTLKHQRSALLPQSDDSWMEEYTKLRRDYLHFTNIYQYPLITNQQQGLEMYAILRKQMDIQTMFDEVATDINAGHEFFNMLQAKSQVDSTVLLQKVATVGLPLSILAGALALANDPEPKKYTLQIDEKGVQTLSPIQTTTKACFLFSGESCKATDWTYFWHWSLAIVIVGLLVMKFFRRGKGK